MRTRPFVLALVLALTCIGCRRDEAASEAKAPDVPPPVLFAVKQAGKYGYMDRTGRIVIEPRYSQAGPFHEGFALVRRGGKFGYVNARGEEVIAPRFDDAWHFSEGRASVLLDGRWGVVDTTGAIIPGEVPTPAAYAQARTTTTGPIRIRVGGRYGFVSPRGDTLVRPIYEQAWYFKDGFARVRERGKWGFVDSTGRLAIPPKFDRAWDFEHGLALVEVDGRRGYVDPTGRYVWEPSE